MRGNYILQEIVFTIEQNINLHVKFHPISIVKKLALKKMIKWAKCYITLHHL